MRHSFQSALLLLTCLLLQGHFSLDFDSGSSQNGVVIERTSELKDADFFHLRWLHLLTLSTNKLKSEHPNYSIEFNPELTQALQYQADLHTRLLSQKEQQLTFLPKFKFQILPQYFHLSESPLNDPTSVIS